MVLYSCPTHPIGVCVWDSCPGLSGMAEHTHLTLDGGDQKQFMSHLYTQTREQGPAHHAQPMGCRRAASRNGAPASGENVDSGLSNSVGWRELKPVAQGEAGRHLVPLIRRMFGGALSAGSQREGEVRLSPTRPSGFQQLSGQLAISFFFLL